LALAAKIGSRLKGGEVFELMSDLGGGKTAFVRGLAKGMGSNDTVRSPSFTISQEYRADELALHHFDFYRLSEPGIVRNELDEVVHEPGAVVAVEWADIVENVLPDERIKVTIKPTDETSRRFYVEFPESLSYLFEGLQ
jgi:tRNA threonylcarbamoyladenosine biosynthesis protein TsaE